MTDDPNFMYMRIYYLYPISVFGNKLKTLITSTHRARFIANFLLFVIIVSLSLSLSVVGCIGFELLPSINPINLYFLINIELELEVELFRM